MTRALLLAALLAAPARAQPAPDVHGVPAPGQRAALFSAWLDKHPDELWSDDMPAAAKQAVAAFKAGKTGGSLRGLRLAGKTADEIDALLKRRGFTRHDDVIRDPKRHDPIAGPDGSAVPMLVYTADDGAMVRVKPRGDPTSKFRPQPDVMKAVRAPPDADYRDFDKEAFKVEAGGDRPIPKWPKDLKNPYKGTALESSFVDGWADAAHGDVRVPAPAPAR